MKSLISVVMPLYNKADTVCQAIDSLVAQSWGDWELLVVDDGSTDGGAALVERYTDPRVTLIRQTNGGVSVARNTALSVARGTFAAFLDADDWWAPCHLHDLVGVASRYPDVVLAGSAFYLVETTGRERLSDIRPAYRKSGDGIVVIDDLGKEMGTVGLPFFTSSIMVRMHALRLLGGFPVGVRAGEDLLTWLRLSCVGQVCLAVRPSAYYRSPPNRGGAHLRQPESPDVVGRELQVLMSRYPQKSDGIKTFLALWHRMRALMYMQLNQRRDSLRSLTMACKLSGIKLRDVVSLFCLALPVVLQEQVFALGQTSCRRVSKGD